MTLAVRLRVPPSRSARPLVVALAILALAPVVLAAPRGLERLAFAYASDPSRRALALARLAVDEDGHALLERAVEDESDPVLRTHALDLAVERLAPEPLAGALARRLARTGPGDHVLLDDLRATAALGDERALPRAFALIFACEDHERHAAFTALAAVLARTGADPAALPRIPWEQREALADLAQGLDDEPLAWRVDALRALVGRLAATPEALARLRGRVTEIDELERQSEDGQLEEDDDERQRALDVLYLRGDPIMAMRRRADERPRALLFLPRATLARRHDASELDHLLACESFDGAGAWRWLETLAADERGRAALRAALIRAPVPYRPWAVAAAIALHRAGDDEGRRVAELSCDATDATGAWARAALGRETLDLVRAAEDDHLEDVPRPVVAERLGPEAIPALVRAAGRPDGRLVQVLEAGAATTRERLLLDLAVDASTRRPVRR